jgi:hypothetical protein
VKHVLEALLILAIVVKYACNRSHLPECRVLRMRYTGKAAGQFGYVHKVFCKRLPAGVGMIHGQTT